MVGCASNHRFSPAPRCAHRHAPGSCPTRRTCHLRGRTARVGATPSPHPLPPTSPPPPAEPASYEAALHELEQLVARIESGQLPLDQMLAGYQRGASLLSFCRQRLDAVQEQIKVLDDGPLQPWVQQ